MKKILPACLIFLFFISIAFAQDVKTYPKRTHYASRLNTAPPKIDGSINDDAWKTVAWSDSFKQFNPIEGDPPSERTMFKMLYGEDDLYFAVMCYDSEPDKISARLARRDDVDESDFIAIGLDTYFDKRTGFIFGINAAGVKMDLIFSNDGDNEDESWDPVWEGKTSLSDSGWVAEIRIPYNQLRFSDNEEQVWGFEILRSIHRKKEEIYWQLIAKDAPGLVSYFGVLRGIHGIKMPPRVELMTYGVYSVKNYEKDDFNPYGPGRESIFNAGLDGKIGINSNLTMDFTINPDFGQVEADPSEVNLSAYESFFEEKRPFFIEGKNIFSFPVAFGDGDWSIEQLFYSRRIGRRPHYYPDEDDGFYYNYERVPQHTRILGAAKISGKTQNGWSIGVMDAVTDKEHAQIETLGESEDVAVEPLTNYFVGRLQKDYNDGNTSIGGMVTATNRKIEKAHLDYLNKSAYTGGLDFRHQWHDKTYFVEAKLAGSYLMGKEDALVQVQRASARYFQRPDAEHVHLDSSRTALGGHGGSIAIGRAGNGHWRFAIGNMWRSPGFELNDIGFLRRADRNMPYIWVGYRENEPKGIIRNYSINFNEWQGWNFNKDLMFVGGNVNGNMQFINYWSLFGGFNRQQDGQDPGFLRGGPMTKYKGGWNGWLGFNSDSRKKLQYWAYGSNYQNDDKISWQFHAEGGLYYIISDKINISLDPFYTKRHENLQYIDNLDFNGEDRYVFGSMQQSTLGTIFRLNYSPTPDLSIQYFGQPFTSSGKYSKIKQIDNPRGNGSERYTLYTDQQIEYDANDEVYYIDEDLDGYSDYAFDKPDYTWSEFLSNLVVRWEYRPGSTLYLVWSQNRNFSESNPVFSVGDNFGDLFKSRPTNVFLIKLNYWLSM